MDEHWTYGVQSVNRIDPDPEDEGGRPCFAVVFDCDGPSASAEVEVFVDGGEDEAEIVRLAMHHLHGSFACWASATVGRHIASDRSAPG